MITTIDINPVERGSYVSFLIIIKSSADLMVACLKGHLC